MRSRFYVVLLIHGPVGVDPMKTEHVLFAMLLLVAGITLLGIVRTTFHHAVDLIAQCRLGLVGEIRVPSIIWLRPD